MAAPTSTTPRVKLASAVAGWLPFITAALAILYLVLAYFLLLVPKIRPLLAGGEYDFSATQTQLTDDEAYIRRTEETVASFGKIEVEKRDRVTAIIPLDPDIPGLLVQIDDIARNNKMALSAIDTAVDEKNVTQQGRKTIRVSLSVTGGDYEQFKLFLGDLERSLRLFDVTTMTFSAEGTVYGLVLKTYYIDRKALPSIKK